MASGGFGVPLPLPGQKERKPILKESDRLHLDAMKMEERLEKLKFQLSKEKDRRDRTSKIGGSTWRSARADQTPSIRGYAKEVQRQIQAKKAMASASLSSIRRDVGRTAAAEPSTSATSADIWQRDPMTWNVRDTMTWLGCLNLAQYQEPFAKNEISGPILMEIGLDDLDYMNITVLAHRKVLLKAVEELRHGGARPPQPPTKQQEQQQQRQPPSDAARRPAAVAGREQKVLVSRPRKINGEDADSEMMYAAMRGGGGGELGQGQYDEKQASASFQEALREWRTGKAGGEDAAADREPTPEQDSSRIDDDEDHQQQQDSGMWRNPFGTPRPLTADEIDHSGGSGGGGGALWGKAPNEDQEHEAFAAAVEAWRRGRSGSNNKDEDAAAAPLVVTREEQDRRRSALDRAAKDLQAKLEEEHRQCREDLARRKEEALRQLSEATMAQASPRAPPAASASSPCASPTRTGDMKKEEEEEEDDDDEEEEAAGLGATDLPVCDQQEADDGGHGAAFVSEEAEMEEVEVLATSVRIEEVGTVMGYTPRGTGRRRRNPLTGMMEEVDDHDEEQEYSVVEGESDDGEGDERRREEEEAADGDGDGDDNSSVTISF